MGKKLEKSRVRSKTLPSSPTHSFSSSSSSSDFEFRISISPRKSSAALCPADELFYKGQLLPLHLSPRISMVRLLESSSTSSSDGTTLTASRDSSSSTDSTSSSLLPGGGDLSLALLAPGEPDSSRPSSATDDEGDHAKRFGNKKPLSSSSSKYFSLSRIFKKDNNVNTPTTNTNTSTNMNGNNYNNISTNIPPRPTSVKKVSSSAKEVIRKYIKKVKPLYEKLSHQKQQQVGKGENQRERLNNNNDHNVTLLVKERERMERAKTVESGFSGNLKYCPKVIRRSYVASCPSSMRSSPSHSGVLSKTGMPVSRPSSSSSSSASSSSVAAVGFPSEASTMEELQNAIQGAIAHCKNSMIQQSISATFNNNSYVSSNKYNKGKCKAVVE